jgi:hypothetical protein
MTLTDISVVCKQPNVQPPKGNVMSKLLTALLAATFAAVTVTPVAFAAEKEDTPKKVQKKGKDTKKSEGKKGEPKSDPKKKKGEGAKTEK